MLDFYQKALQSALNSQDSHLGLLEEITNRILNIIEEYQQQNISAEEFEEIKKDLEDKYFQLQERIRKTRENIQYLNSFK